MNNSFKSITLYLIGANIIAYACQHIIPGFESAFILNSARIPHEPWRVITSMFLHGSPSHIMFNMYALFMFGSLLEQRIGWKRFVIIYFGAGVVAGSIASYFYPMALGASGAIMGIIGALIILMPNLQLLLFFVIPMPLWVAGIVYAAIDAFGIFVPTGIANIAHLVGMGFGLAAGLLLKNKKRRFERKFSAKKHLDEEDLEEYLQSGRI